MPVDKFGRMSDTKTKDTGVSLTYINNNYIRSDGSNPVSGSIDMNGNNLYNVSDPVNPQDVATKQYVDNTKGSAIIGKKINNAVSIRESLDFTGKHKLKNLPEPADNGDAVNKKYVDEAGGNLKLDLQQGQAFVFLNNEYQAKGSINMRDNLIKNVGEPQNDKDATHKKYVDDLVNLKSVFVNKNGGYYSVGNIFLKRYKLGGLRDPTLDGEAANKKYVDDVIQKQFIDENDNIVFGRDIDTESKKNF